MTTEQIRKSIHTTWYGIFENGIRVEYTWHDTRDSKGTQRTLTLLSTEAIEELKAMGEIEIEDWKWVSDNYILSQYDAIQLVIRHEYAKSLDNDITLLEMDKALDALK
jgi:hypothetical protein